VTTRQSTARRQRGFAQPSALRRCPCEERLEGSPIELLRVEDRQPARRDRHNRRRSPAALEVGTLTKQSPWSVLRQLLAVAFDPNNAVEDEAHVLPGSPWAMTTVPAAAGRCAACCSRRMSEADRERSSALSTVVTSASSPVAQACVDW